MKKVFLLPIIYVLSVLIANPLLAKSASDDLYLISNIHVDVTDETAAIARNKAFDMAKNEAVHRAISRITLKYDTDKVPQISPEDVNALTKELVVNSEKSSGVRYIADINVLVDSSGIETLLKKNSIPFTKHVKNPVLIIPVYYKAKGAKPLLWEEQNPWLKAWQQSPPDNKLVPVMVPMADVSDMNALNASDVADAGAPELTKIAQIYGVNEVYIAKATLQENKIDVVLRGINLAKLEDYTYTSFSSDNTDFQNAVARTGMEIEDLWKESQVVQYNEISEIIIVSPINGLQDWLVIKSKLEDNSLVTGVYLQAMKHNLVQAKISFSGSLRMIKNSFAEKGMSLHQTSGYWVIDKN